MSGGGNEDNRDWGRRKLPQTEEKGELAMSDHIRLLHECSSILVLSIVVKQELVWFREEEKTLDSYSAVRRADTAKRTQFMLP